MNTLVRENRNANQQRSEQFVTPAASVIEDGDAYLLNVEMPGVNKEGLEISVENNELRIIGRRSLPEIDGTLVHRESRSENFRRMFELDPASTRRRFQRASSKGFSRSDCPRRSR